MATTSRTEKELPLDLVEEILLRILVKPLHRFLCVSKPWYSLISSPSFRKHHYRHQSLQNPLLLLIQNDKDGDRSHLRFSTWSYQGDLLNQFSKTVPINNIFQTTPFQAILDPPSPYSILQFCFGLVSLLAFRRPILVCNPSTQQLIALPLPTTEGSLDCLGFGYAPSTREFKVVRFFYCDVYGCEIFTFGTTECWREATSPPPFQFRADAPFFHGALHLMPREDKTLVDRHIVAFDIDTEEYREIPFPDIYSSRARPLISSDIEIKEFRGSLYLTFFLRETGKKVLEFWFLKDYNNHKWVKECVIDVSAVRDVRALAIMGDGRILFREDNNELAYYSTQEKCLGERFLKQKIDGYWYVTLYMESFLHLGRLEQIGSSAAPLADLLLNPSDGTVQN